MATQICWYRKGGLWILICMILSLTLLMDEMTESASDIFVFFVFVICVVLEKLANSFVVASKRA